MGTLTVVKPGLQTLIQDQGRIGLAFYAIPRSGPLDPQSADLANTLLGNPQNAPIIECHFVPPTLRFDTGATICLTGADMRWQINGHTAKQRETLTVPAGSLLSGTPSREGCRGYIGIRSFIQTEQTFGSAASYPLCGFGGNQGKALAQGDTIVWQESNEPSLPLRFSMKSTKPDEDSLSWLPGPEFEWLNSASKVALQTQSFSIAPESDRMGARLSGPALETAGQALLDSVPLLPGFVQLLPSGQCIVVLQDGQTTGGYPRIGFLAAAALCRFNQIPLKQSFRFRLAAAPLVS